MMFYLCRDARRIFDKLGIQADSPNALAYRLACDQVVLRFAPASIDAFLQKDDVIEVSQLKAKLVDAPFFNLSAYRMEYRWVTEQYVTHDYPRMDLLKLASIISGHELRVIETIGQRCKALRHFSIPYLAASLDNEGSEVIEALRKENRLDALAAETVPLELGAVRPVNLSKHLADLEEDRKINDALKG